MFWRFGFNTVSAIDQLLEKDDVTLEELLDEEDLLQECKAHNLKLVEFLSEPAQLEKLLNYIINDGDGDKERLKYPYLASEVIACEIWSICEAIVDNRTMLQRFWNFLNRPAPLNPHQASYFSKVVSVLLQKKTTEVLNFIKAQPNVLSRFLEHIATSAIMDLLLKIISMEEIPDGHGVVEWLNSEGLMSALIGRLDPNLDPDVHAMAAQVLLDIITISQSSNPEQPSIGTNSLIYELKSAPCVIRLVDYMLDPKAPNSTSTLVNGVAIFIELIRRNYNDMEEEEEEDSAAPPVDLSDLIRVLSARLPEFQQLLVRPKSVPEPVDTTMGRRVPLGFERLRVCELFAELLHLSNMALLNMIPAQLDEVYINNNMSNSTVAAAAAAMDTTTADNKTSSNNVSNTTQSKDTANTDNVTAIADKNEEISPSTPTAESSTLPKDNNDDNNITNNNSNNNTDAMVTDVSKQSSTSISPSKEAQETIAAGSNAVTGQLLQGATAGDALKLKFIETGVLTTCLDLFFDFPWNNFLHTVVYDMVHQVTNLPLELGCNRDLIISLFRDAQITRRIAAAQRQNDYSVEQPKGVRLGYMGHLTFIADQVVRLLERAMSELGGEVESICMAEDWQEYVSKTLRDTKERDRQQLGGTRPNALAGGLSMLNLVGNDDEDDEDDDDDEDGNGVLGGAGSSAAELASDQFARYLCQQITSDLPDKFGSSDDEDDEDADGGWLGEVEFDASGSFDADNNLVSAELLGHTAPLRLDMDGDNNNNNNNNDDDEIEDEITHNKQKKHEANIINQNESILENKKSLESTNAGLSASSLSDASLRGVMAASSHQTTSVISSNTCTVGPQHTSDGHLVTVADWKTNVQRSALVTDISNNLLNAIDMDDDDDDDIEIEEDDILDGDLSDLAENSFGSEDQDRIHMLVAMKPT